MNISSKNHQPSQVLNRLSRLDSSKRDLLRTRLLASKIPNRYPVSSIQHGIWVQGQRDPEDATYNNPAALEIQGSLDQVALKAALRIVVDRHPVLRSRYEDDEDGTLWAYVTPTEYFQLPWRVVDTSKERMPYETAAQCVAADAQLTFRLATGPVWRGLLVRWGEASYILLLTFHHIVSDGGSLDVLLRELHACYLAVSVSQEPPLPPAGSAFELIAKHEAWSTTGAADNSLHYWRNRLHGAPMNINLMAAAEDVDPSHTGSTVQLALPQSLTAKLANIGGVNRVSLFTVLLAAYCIFLHSASGQCDLVFTMPVDTRGAEGAGVVGCFVNTTVLRIQVRPADTGVQVIAGAGQALAEILDHRNVPFPTVLAALGLLSGRSIAPFGSVSIVHNNAPAGSVSWPGLRIAPHWIPIVQGRHDLELSVHLGDRAVFGWMGTSGKFSQSQTEEFTRQFISIADRMADNPCRSVSEILPALPGRKLW